MTSYATEQASGTFANTATTILQAGVILTGLLGLNPEKVDAYRINATSHYRLGGESKIFSQLANTFTGEYPTQGFDFESAVSTFYAKLLSNQEPLGSKFEEVLHKNRWALYSRS
jgi:hypothetical protein